MFRRIEKTNLNYLNHDLRAINSWINAYDVGIDGLERNHVIFLLIY